MKGLPRFSIVICNYNYEAFVGDAIESALGQQYADDRFEVIVVDDGSTDGSRSVIDSYLSDRRVRAVYQENRGQSAAFQAGVSVAEGDYICLLDSDDVYLPDKLARVASKIAELGVAPDKLFMCHDLFIEDSSAGTMIEQSWFDVAGVSQLPDRLGLAHPAQMFPYSVPCGLVFSRNVVAAILESLPTWAFARGADGVVCPAAFLMTGEVHYLRERLGAYRVHGGNEAAGLANGRYTWKIDWRTRTPKTLRFLYEWLDVLDLAAPERSVALDFLFRFEHLGRRLSAARGLHEPLVSIVEMGARQNAARASGLQSHPRVVWQHELGLQPTCGAPESSPKSDLLRLRQAYEGSGGDFIVFLRAGDQLDREFVERHLYWHQHGALVGLSCSDVRLATPDGHLLHAGVYQNSGAWKQPLQQIPPFATAMRDWVVPPMSACLLRRNALLDRFFELAAELPAELADAGYWLLVQFQHHTSGVLRLRETLTTCTVTDGAAASYGYLAAPAGLDGALRTPSLAAALAWFADFHAREQVLLRRWLSPAWHQRFGVWLREQQARA